MTELRDAVAAAKEFLEWMPSYDDEIIQVIRVEDVEDAVAAAISAWNRRAPSAAVVGLVEAAELLAGFAESASTLDFNEDRNVTWAAVVSAQARSALAAYKQEIKG